MKMDKQTVLKQYFGHDEFRNGQEPLIDALLAGRDVLGIMPTGGGKSLCYQIPALLLPGVTLVISPLISLMKDQVMALKDAGVDAAFINSSLTAEQLREVYRRLRGGAYKLVYVAPERLMGEGFSALMAGLTLSLVAVDEAHCISQWGQDFRPSYLRISEFLDRLPTRPVLAAFTATATEEVRQDIARSLQLCDPLTLVTGFDRPNLFFDVRKPKSKLAVLCGLVEERRDKTGIIYCATRVNVERVCEELNARGLSATRYHAGLADRERRQNQDDFQFDRKTVMVATNAFGMGIDKSNVSFVIHYNMPKSLEAYYQEAGRAGRDGEPADCILLYSAGDITTAKFLIQNSSDNSELDYEDRRRVQELDYARLDDMIAYCKTTACLRGHILDYFGQAHEEACANCGNCRHTFTEQDITREAQMILSCVRRVHDFLGYSVGVTLIVRTLHGSKEQRVLELRLDELSTYGLLAQTARTQIREYIDYLEAQGYLHIDPTYSTLELTAASAALLRGEETVSMPVKLAPPEPEQVRRRKSGSAAAEYSSPLMDALKAVRFQLAQEEGVPAYIVFSNATLADMAAKQPRTPAEFLEVNGVGEKKAARYGRIFLQAIADFTQDDDAE